MRSAPQDARGGLRIVTGRVSAAGAVDQGTDFSVTKISAGLYTVRFPTIVRLVSLVVTPYSGANHTVTTSGITANSMNVSTFNAGSGAITDASFYFQATAA